MADEKPKKEAEAGEKGGDNPERSSAMLTAAIVGGLMLLEAVGIFVAVNFLGGEPAETEAAATADGSFVTDDEGNLMPVDTEIPVVNFMALNNKSGYVYAYQISVHALVETSKRRKISTFLDHRKQTLADHMTKIIRASDPKYMDEPGLETIRRQFKQVLDEVLNDDTLVKEVLLPEFSASRAD